MGCIGDIPCRGERAVKPWCGLLEGDAPPREALGAESLFGEISILRRVFVGLMIVLGKATARLGSGCWTCASGILECIRAGENRDGDIFEFRLTNGNGRSIGCRSGKGEGVGVMVS